MLIGYGTAICYVGLVLTASRGGYLSAGVSLLVFAFLSLTVLRRTRSRSFWKVSGAGALAAVVLSLVIVLFISRSPFLRGRAQHTFETTNMRVDLWRGALQQWKLQPILGTGAGTYLYYGRLFRTERVQLDPIYTHNDYLNLLAEYGYCDIGSGPGVAWDLSVLFDAPDDPKIHAATIATPSGLHAAVAVPVLEAGKAVLCEKPIDVTIEAVDAILAAEKKGRGRLACVFQARFGSGAQQLKA